MIEKIISGGQIGADIAGLRAGKALGLETGGHAPKGFRTLKGRNPQLAEYGVVEHEAWQYVPRTRENVRNSDGTVRFALNFDSPGERATLREAETAGKPVFDVQLFKDALNHVYTHMTILEKLIAWLWENNIKTLNIAGNGREDIEKRVEAVLEAAIRTANKHPDQFKEV